MAARAPARRLAGFPPAHEGLAIAGGRSGRCSKALPGARGPGMAAPHRPALTAWRRGGVAVLAGAAAAAERSIPSAQAGTVGL
jgi:hypothetical protein